MHQGDCCGRLQGGKCGLSTEGQGRRLRAMPPASYIGQLSASATLAYTLYCYWSLQRWRGCCSAHKDAKLPYLLHCTGLHARPVHARTPAACCVCVCVCVCVSVETSGRAQSSGIRNPSGIRSSTAVVYIMMSGCRTDGCLLYMMSIVLVSSLIKCQLGVLSVHWI